MRLWWAYAAVAVAVTIVGVASAGLLSPDVTAAVRLAAVVALGVQLVAFALLVALRRQPRMLLAAWAVGVLLRLAALISVGLWLTGGGPVPAKPALLTMVLLLTVLALLEPLALRPHVKPTRSVC